MSVDQRACEQRLDQYGILQLGGTEEVDQLLERLALGVGLCRNIPLLVLELIKDVAATRVVRRSGTSFISGTLLCEGV